MNAIEISGVSVTLDGTPIVHGVDLTVAAGSWVTVIGPNGAGKSTLLKAVYGLVTRTGGTVRWGGEDVTGARADRLTRRGLNFVPQTDNVFPTLTVAENVHVGSLVVPKAERDAAVQRVRELFPILRERARQRAGTLSGGERKLVALARAFVTGPRLLLLDEPSAGLSQREAESLQPLLFMMRDELGAALLVIEHDTALITAVSDRIVAMDVGRVIADDRPEQVMHDPAVLSSYLGAAIETAPVEVP